MLLPFSELVWEAVIRLVSGADLDELKSSEISGPSAEIVLKFGKF